MNGECDGSGDHAAKAVPKPAVLPRHGSALPARPSVAKEASSSPCTPPTVAPAFAGPEGRLFRQKHASRGSQKAGEAGVGEHYSGRISPDNILSVVCMSFSITHLRNILAVRSGPLLAFTMGH